jgi:hypothetical protein
MTKSLEKSLWKKAPRTGLALCLATTALFACSSHADIDDRSSMSASARYNHDYAGGDQDAFDPVYYQSCLEGTPYDIDNYLTPSGTLNTTPEGIVVVTPANVNGDKLTLKDPGVSQLLAPVDDISNRILTNYGCQVGGAYQE